MGNHTASSGQAVPPLSGDELYNMLMRGIEPDLTTDQLPTLDAKYKDETPEQAKTRALRYEKAFKEYEKQLAEYLAQLSGKVHVYQTAARQSAEEDSRTQEGSQLSGLEDAISGQ